MKNERNTPKTLTLTNQEWLELSICILISTEFQEGLAKTMEGFVSVKNSDESPRFKSTVEDIQYIREMNSKLMRIWKKIDVVIKSTAQDMTPEEKSLRHTLMEEHKKLVKGSQCEMQVARGILHLLNRR